MPSPHEGILDSMAGDVPTKKTLSWLRVLRSVFSLSWPERSDKPLRPTAYLDGLRGFAAFLVYWHHHELFSHAATSDALFARFEHSWGWKGFFHFATFPWVRNFFSGGHIAVAVFYVISGYVLSVKPLSLIHNGEHLKVADNLGSAFFRRWFRLFIPIIVTTFLFMTSWHVFDIWLSTNQKQPTYGAELWKWYAEFKNFSFIFNMGGEPWFSYNFHTWSIPVEMKGSIIVYTAVQAFSRLSKGARLLGELGLIFYFLYIADGWYGAMFTAGLLLSDLDLLAIKGELPRLLLRLEPYKLFIFYHLLVISIYLGGVPSHSSDLKELRGTRGWYYLSYLKPQAVFDYKWFYLFWAANMIVASVPRIPWVKYFFETRFCQYLGRISYALYLVHGPIINTLGDRLYFAVGWIRPLEGDQKMLASWMNIFPLPRTGPLGLEVSFLVPHIILLPFTIWMADIVTRGVDEPTVKFAQWLYRKTLGGPQEKPEDVMRLA
ncbi:hypothetical protein CONLIGDRAFT_630034 [Coniochaeta ligniaria NRRL 30616]|uniref:Acyltransferase 3 domain-containing protein n=1 Tax=Coniochaeta ligniaria NRRL 30616 TaxID=1408157 RepID=A0A1J7IXX2_9PEZI|nr:hypothetical protein CONLIGDRAFT_630034 [Coniochaeta ligniaria NRRL 30616]